MIVRKGHDIRFVIMKVFSQVCLVNVECKDVAEDLRFSTRVKDMRVNIPKNDTVPVIM